MTIDGQRRLKAGARFVHRRGRAWFAGRALSCRSRRRHDWPDRQRCRRYLESAATTAARDERCRPQETGIGARPFARCESARGCCSARRQFCARQRDDDRRAITTWSSMDRIISRRVICRTTFVFGCASRTSTDRFFASTARRPCSRRIWAVRVIAVFFRNRRTPGSVPNCAEAGVLGVLPGIIGTLQALEAIKLHHRHRRFIGRPAAAFRCAEDEVS